MIATRSRTRLLRFNHRQWTGIKRWKHNADFTTYRRLHEQAGRSEGGGSSGNEKQRPGGSYAWALGVFAAGIPIGWVIHAFQDSKKDAPNTAKPTEFVKYALIDKEDISSTCSIFTLKPASSSAISTTQLYDQRAITSVQFKQPQLQIARSYTTLPPVEGQETDELRFLIRREQKGEVSGYLHRLPLGSEVEVRGPSVEYVLPDDVEEVVCLAGGTGIAPALQVADKLEAMAKMHILWASRRREDCEGGVSDTRSKATSTWTFFTWFSPFGLPSSDELQATSRDRSQPNALVSQVDSLKGRQDVNKVESGSLMVDYYVDDEGSFIQPSQLREIVGRSTQSEQGRRLLFVSGPEGFVDYWAGPKQWLGGQEVQGPLGGVLATLELRGWKVVKL